MRTTPCFAPLPGWRSTQTLLRPACEFAVRAPSFLHSAFWSGTGPVAQPVFKTGPAWQPHACSVRLRGRSAPTKPACEGGFRAVRTRCAVTAGNRSVRVSAGGNTGARFAPPKHHPPRVLPPFVPMSDRTAMIERLTLELWCSGSTPRHAENAAQRLLGAGWRRIAHPRSTSCRDAGQLRKSSDCLEMRARALVLPPVEGSPNAIATTKATPRGQANVW